jgi:hypothetical protein
MDMFNLLWDLQQHQKIEETSNAIEGIKQDAVELGEKLYIPYFKELNKLTLVCQAMWSLIEERTDLTEKDLQNRVTELDLKDGKLDGKYTTPPVECPKCGAKICKKFNRCLFCGYEDSEGSAFNAL